MYRNKIYYNYTLFYIDYMFQALYSHFNSATHTFFHFHLFRVFGENWLVRCYRVTKDFRTFLDPNPKGPNEISY